MADRNASVARSQSASAPTDFSGGRVASCASKSSKPNVRQHAKDERQQARELIGGLFTRAEDMAVVLREAANPKKSVEGTGALVPIDRSEFEESQRQARGTTVGDS